MMKLEVDGKTVEVENGATLMEAANKLGIFVPHFCYHKKLSIAANCRMCLVQVEKAPKPLPACATPATEGMKVMTDSVLAKTAQQGVMEFLLINHPLDCPICDQGGECQLQDLAVGYGGSGSRYQEEKRVVFHKDIGPLVSMEEMSRCIHCTRCVRFGQEIAGVMELGMAGRGEHSEIVSFVGKSVDSELSGNMIDLCPVGALTSKPFRYSARTWELSRRKSIAPHDGLGSNLVIQVKQDRVMRVLPLENEAVNECWLSDRDRFSYEALNSDERLTTPMVKKDGKWMETDWQNALQTVADGLEQYKTAKQAGADQVAVLASPSATLEELHLLAKLGRSLGSKQLTTRHRQRDTAAFGKSTGAQWLGTSLTNIGNLQSILLIGSTLRKEQPLLATRFRAAAKRGAQINVVHALDGDMLMRVANRSISKPENLAAALGAVTKALAEIKNAQLPGEVANAVANVAITAEAQAIAASLAAKELTGVFLGHYAQQHPQATTLHVLAQEIARLAGGVFGVFGQAANSVGAAVVGADAAAPSAAKAYLLLNVEPEADCADAAGHLAALKGAEFVVAMSMFKNSLAAEYATVMLPIAPFSETAGTFVNMEGKAQFFNGVVKPLGQTRPAWKVIRVLGNLLGLSGFDQDNIEAVRADIAPDLNAFVAGKLNNQMSGVKVDLAACAAATQMSDVNIYEVDSITRRAPSLQMTADAKASRIHQMAEAAE
ncbi:MAG: NADH-quinone oxidoreductase subunit G [Rhodocyclaceae bacterium]|nr:NADH-quinone oxidoreductase subunit G [Rhodocyclaceae bacterium]